MNLNGPPFTFRDALQTVSGALELLNPELRRSNVSRLFTKWMAYPSTSRYGYSSLKPRFCDPSRIWKCVKRCLILMHLESDGPVTLNCHMTRFSGPKVRTRNLVSLVTHHLMGLGPEDFQCTDYGCYSSHSCIYKSRRSIPEPWYLAKTCVSSSRLL